MRLIHVVENMHDQAVENWIFRIMRDSRDKYPDVEWTFFCVHPKEGRLDESVRRLGGQVIHSKVPIGKKREFIRGLHETLVAGEYDVMHTHHDIVSSVYLIASMRTGLRRRIVHVHNTSMSLPTPSLFKRAIVRGPLRRTCLLFADRIVGISRDALNSMIRGIPKSPRDVVVYYGIDTEKFRSPKRTAVATRAAIGVSATAKMILFAGRMTEYKNPRFVVNVLAEILPKFPNAVAVFAGVGPETKTVSRLARERGLSEQIRLLGWRDDLAELMLAADLLLWPGQEVPKEGLGLGIVEAQAAGLPIVMSLSVPIDAVVVKELVSILPLATGAAAWGNEARRILAAAVISREDSLARIEASPFSLAAGTANVMSLYEGIN